MGVTCIACTQTLSSLSLSLNFSFQSVFLLCKGSQISVALAQAGRVGHLSPCRDAERQEVLGCGCLQPALGVDDSGKLKLPLTEPAGLPFAPRVNDHGKDKQFRPLRRERALSSHDEGLWPTSRNGKLGIFLYCFPFLLFVCLFEEALIEQRCPFVVAQNKGRFMRSFTCCCFPVWSRKGWTIQTPLKTDLCSLSVSGFAELCFPFSGAVL